MRGRTGALSLRPSLTADTCPYTRAGRRLAKTAIGREPKNTRKIAEGQAKKYLISTYNQNEEQITRTIIVLSNKRSIRIDNNAYYGRKEGGGGRKIKPADKTKKGTPKFDERRKQRNAPLTLISLASKL